MIRTEAVLVVARPLFRDAQRRLPRGAIRHRDGTRSTACSLEEQRSAGPLNRAKAFGSPIAFEVQIRAGSNAPLSVLGSLLITSL